MMTEFSFLSELFLEGFFWALW